MRLLDHREDLPDGGCIYYSGVLSDAGRWLFDWSPLYRLSGKLRCLSAREYLTVLYERFAIKRDPDLPDLFKRLTLEVPLEHRKPIGMCCDYSGPYVRK